MDINDPNEKKPMGRSDWWEEFNLDPKVKDGITCEVVNCSLDSTHYTRVKCCFDSFIACEQHTHEFMQTVRHFFNQGKMLVCKYCHRPHPPVGYLSRPQTLALDTTAG